MWHQDLSHGGGQLVRTALAVAALRAEPCRLTGIRAIRSRPGLARQHVAAVKALAQAVGGEVSGAELGSTTVEFLPGGAAGPLDITVEIGTAGSTTLVLQALLPLLARRGGRIAVGGGTDNPLAPPIDFVREVLLPALAELGVRLEVELEQRGYYPRGGGRIVARAAPQPTWPGGERVEWSGPVRLDGVAYSSHLPLHVTERMRDAALKALRKGEGLSADQRVRLRRCEQAVELRPDEPANSPGAGLVLWAADEAGRRVSGSALGAKGKPAEEVAREAASLLLQELATGAPCDRHLGDQLAVWAALAEGPSTWRVSQRTDHLDWCLALLEAGLGVHWRVEETTITRI